MFPSARYDGAPQYPPKAHLLTGALLLSRWQSYQIVEAVLHEGMRPRLDGVHPPLPPRLAALMERCWATNPAARPRCDAVAAALADPALLDAHDAESGPEAEAEAEAGAEVAKANALGGGATLRGKVAVHSGSLHNIAAHIINEKLAQRASLSRAASERGHGANSSRSRSSREEARPSPGSTRRMLFDSGALVAPSFMDELDLGGSAHAEVRNPVHGVPNSRVDAGRLPRRQQQATENMKIKKTKKDFHPKAAVKKGGPPHSAYQDSIQGIVRVNTEYSL